MRWARMSCCSSSAGGETSRAEYSVVGVGDSATADEVDPFRAVDGRRVKFTDYWRSESYTFNSAKSVLLESTSLSPTRVG